MPTIKERALARFSHYFLGSEHVELSIALASSHGDSVLCMRLRVCIERQSTCIVRINSNRVHRSDARSLVVATGPCRVYSLSEYFLIFCAACHRDWFWVRWPRASWTLLRSSVVVWTLRLLHAYGVRIDSFGGLIRQNYLWHPLVTLNSKIA